MASSCGSGSKTLYFYFFQYLLVQAVVPFCRPCTIIFLIVFALITPSDSTLPSFAPKDSIAFFRTIKERANVLINLFHVQGID
jgi:hypothetical protein